MIRMTYRVDWEALLARAVYRWHWMIALAALLLAGGGGLASGLIPPAWRGAAQLTVLAAPEATVMVDGRPWPRPVYAGPHRVSAALPGGRSSWADVELRAGEPLTLTLPAGLAPPLVRPLPPAGPGLAVAQVWWADGAWRVVSAPPAAPEASPEIGDPTPTPAPSHTQAVSRRSTERLSTIDAYAGLADQVHLGERTVEAVYRPSGQPYGADSAGTVEVRGWRAALVTTPISAELALLRLAPDGESLLLAERTPGGEQVSVVQRGGGHVPVVAVPGAVRRVSWSADGGALAIHSQSGVRLALTLVRLRPTLAAATVADVEAGSCAGDLIPLAWGAGALTWSVPRAEGAGELWLAPLTTLVPERRGTLQARALHVLPDGSLRVLAESGGALVAGRYQGNTLVVEATIPDVPLESDLCGEWHGDDLLLQSRRGVWLATFTK